MGKKMKGKPKGKPKPKPEREKNPAAVALGRLGGRLGGLARAKALSPKRRQEISRMGAVARWGEEKAS